MATGGNKQSLYSRLLRIAGDKRLPGQGKDRTTNFAVDTGSVLQRVKTISVTTVSFLNTFYNIIGFDASYSMNAENIFTLGTVTAGPTGHFQSFQIPAGYWSAGTLNSALSTIATTFLQTYDGTASVTFATDPITSLTTITVISNLGLTLYFMVTSQSALSTVYTTTNTGALTGNVISLPSGIQMATNPITKLGFINTIGPSVVSGTATQYIASDNFLAITGAAAPGTVATSPNVIALAGLTKCYIQSSRLANGNACDEKGNVNPIMLPIPITAAYGQLNVFDCRQDILCEIQYPRPIELNYIDIQLVDRNGTEVNLQGANLQIELRVWFDAH